jgi:hypothetical protein
MELVTDPSVLVCDEPTSGLDSATALSLMRTLHALAAGSRVVLLSLHQPSPAAFGLLDRAMLLAAGRCVYAGPPAGADRWFAAAGAPCPDGTAIAEHMLQVGCPLTAAQARPAGFGLVGGTRGALPPRKPPCPQRPAGCRLSLWWRGGAQAGPRPPARCRR